MKCTRERLKGSPRYMPAIIRGLEGVFQFPQEGRRAIPFDVRIDPQSMDLLSPQGFANALHAVCCLKPGSAALAAPVCSTFVFMILAQGLQKVFLLRIKYFCGFALKPNAWPSQCFNSPSTTLLQCLSQVKGIDPSEQNQSSWSEGFQGMCGWEYLNGPHFDPADFGGSKMLLLGPRAAYDIGHGVPPFVPEGSPNAQHEENVDFYVTLWCPHTKAHNLVLRCGGKDSKQNFLSQAIKRFKFPLFGVVKTLVKQSLVSTPGKPCPAELSSGQAMNASMIFGIMRKRPTWNAGRWSCTT